tara:strand:+ start:20654 stop:22114 length:1461 start_codon:yes stop_codon:yes gene_type:complete
VPFRHLIHLLFFLIGCQSKFSSDNQLEILALVGDRIITVQDFMNRSEYTLRPEYCRGNLYIHKKIILNNLIAEKLLAIETESVNNQIKPDNLNAFLKGRKEQAMRQLLYFEKGHNKVLLEDDEINHFFKMAGRTYHVNYFSFPGGAFADSVKRAIDEGMSFNDIYSVNFEGNIPARDVNWIDNNDPFISDRLFNNEIQKGQVIGPYFLNDGSAFIMEVNGWTDRLDLSDKGNFDRRKLVINTLKDRKGKEIYKSYIKEIMKGNEINLNESVFLPYSKAIRDQFFRSQEEKETAISSALFGNGEFLSLEDIQPMNQKYKDLVLLTLNGDNWTVKDFEKNIASHPLVFRKKKMNKSEFSQQFKLAIVDFIQDRYLTEKAYELGLDKTNSIKLNESLWADSYTAYQSAKLWMSTQSDSIEQHVLMKPIIDNLQKKYSPQISINMKLFESIKISSVDMFVTQGNVPYPVIVPSFPSYTIDSYIDYGSTIN